MVNIVADIKARDTALIQVTKAKTSRIWGQKKIQMQDAITLSDKEELSYCGYQKSTSDLKFCQKLSNGTIKEFTVGLKYWKSKVSYNRWEQD